MKSILITGSSSGLGYELAKRYQERGYNVVGISRSISNLDITQFKVDFLDLNELNKVLINLPLDLVFDIVYLNAGSLGELKKARDLSIKDFNDIMKINVLANKLIIDYLIKQKIFRNLIAISSGASIKAYFGWSLYCISKAAFKQLVETYSLENKEFYFLNLAPGLIKSKMQKKIFNTDSKIIPSVSKFQKIYDEMDSPAKVAERIILNHDHLLSFTSGSYFDLRNLD